MKKILTVVLCLALLVSSVAFAEGKFTAGSYTGTAKGFGGDVNVTVEVSADAIMNVTAEGAGIVYATDAGDQRETETFLRPDKKALAGMLVACLRANGSAGSVTVTCSADALESGSVQFECV